MVLHQICKVSSLFRSLLLFLLCTCNLLHCLFVCVSMPTYKRSTRQLVPCKMLKVNQDGTMSIEYLHNGKWIPHCTAGAGNIVEDEDFEVAYEDLPMTLDGRCRAEASRDIPDAASKADSDSSSDSDSDSHSSSYSHMSGIGHVMHEYRTLQGEHHVYKQWSIQSTHR